MQLSREEFEQFRAFVLQESGLRFEFDHHELLRLALRDRMSACKLHSLQDYYRLLKTDTKKIETQAFIHLLTVGETYFFRNKAHFAALERHILPHLASKKIKVWSAACSTGEEPYSIAISLMEALPYADVSILATDLNHEHIAIAKRAVYSARSVKDVSPERLSKYFTFRHNKYALNDSVKTKVNFAYHNLANDPFDRPEMKDVDLIFCRNVMIYFSIDTIQRILGQFYDSLHEDGYLFIGDAESLWHISNQFTPVEFPHTLLYRKQGVLHPKQEETTEPIILPPSPLPAALPTIKEAYSLAEQGKNEEAIAILNNIIKKDSLSVEAYYLLGVLYQKQKSYKQAIDAFKRTLYVDSSIDLAHISLANIYLQINDKVKAMHEYKNALKSLQTKPDEEPVRFLDDTPCSYLRTICQQSLEQLGSAK